MMVSHHHSCPVVVAMPLRCVKHPGPFPPPTIAFGSSPLCEQRTGNCEGGIHCFNICKMEHAEVAVATPFRCVKHPGPVLPLTVAFGRTPLCDWHSLSCRWSKEAPLHHGKATCAGQIWKPGYVLPFLRWLRQAYAL